MEEMFETFGQAILTVVASSTLVVISTALFYNLIVPFINNMLQQLI